MKKAIEQILVEQGVSKNSRFLLAASGGVDSMVLLDVFHSMNLNFEVAHCNFGLRGTDSELDALLVEQICQKKEVHFFSKRIEIASYKKENQVSTQMAARDLRYKWFDELLKEYQFDFLVTAHHLDDSIETFFLNLTRGTGIEGLVGIKTVSNFVLRPLNSVSKSEIKDYAHKHQIEYREDVSNFSDAYKRNKIRNNVIPVFTDINPSFSLTMASNFDNLKEVVGFYKDAMNDIIHSLIKEKEGRVEIDLSVLKKQKHKGIVLFEVMKSYGFERSQVNQLLEVLVREQSVGKEFYSPSHRLLVDRSFVFIEEITERKKEIFVLSNQNNFVTFGLELTFNQIPISEIDLLADSRYAFLDADKIQFPLSLRIWKEGDKFRPFGMRGKKKVSDFLIDKKLSRFEKENTWVLLSDNQIIWIVGHRIDDSFKLTDSSKTVLKITFESN